MSYQRDREEFIAVIAAESLRVVKGETVIGRYPTPAEKLGIARAILRDATTIQRLAEVACNREMTKSEERSEAHAMRRIKERCATVGIEAKFQGDPRGACVKLRLPSGRSNDFGGEGLYCAPTRVR